MNSQAIATLAVVVIIILAFVNGETVNIMRNRRIRETQDPLTQYRPVLALMQHAPAPGTTTTYRIERLIAAHGNVTY